MRDAIATLYSCVSVLARLEIIAISRFAACSLLVAAAILLLPAIIVYGLVSVVTGRRSGLLHAEGDETRVKTK